MSKLSILYASDDLKLLNWTES